jgi:hypothetical protein
MQIKTACRSIDQPGGGLLCDPMKSLFRCLNEHFQKLIGVTPHLVIGNSWK